MGSWWWGSTPRPAWTAGGCTTTFPETRPLDLERYPPAALLRHELAAAGFQGVESSEAEHFRMQLPVAEVRARGFLDRTFTSQLTILTDEEYQGGLRRLAEATAAAEAHGSQLVLETSLRLFATSAWRQR